MVLLLCSSRWLRWKVDIASIVFLLVVAVPWKLFYSVFSSSRSERLRKAAAFGGAVLMLFYWHFFWSILDAFPIMTSGKNDSDADDTSRLDLIGESVGRIAIVGVSLMASISGFGAVYQGFIMYDMWRCTSGTPEKLRSLVEQHQYTVHKCATLSRGLVTLDEVIAIIERDQDAPVDASLSVGAIANAVPVPALKDIYANDSNGFSKYDVYSGLDRSLSLGEVSSIGRIEAFRDVSYADAPSLLSRLDLAAGGVGSGQLMNGHSEEFAQDGTHIEGWEDVERLNLYLLQLTGLRDELVADREYFESGAKSLFLEMCELQDEHERSEYGRTPFGRVLILINSSYLVYCVYRFIMSALNVVYDRRARQDIVSKMAVWVSRYPWLAWLNGLFAVRSVSFVFITVMFVVSLRGFFLNARKFLVLWVSPVSRASVLHVLSFITGCYFIASMMLMRMALPYEYRMIVTAVMGNQQFQFYHRWNDLVFFGSSLITLGVHYLMRRARRAAGVWHTYVTA